MLNRFLKLLEVKSIVTIVLTLTMVGLMFRHEEINKDLLMLFSSTYGAVITYFFTRRNEKEDEKDDTDNKKVY